LKSPDLLPGSLSTFPLSVKIKARLPITAILPGNWIEIILKMVLKYKLRYMKIRNAGYGILIPGIILSAIGFPMLGISGGLVGYSLWLNTQYWDTSITDEENLLKPEIQQSNMIASVGIPLIITGSVMSAIGMILDIIAIPTLVNARNMKKVIEDIEGLSIAPVIEYGDGLAIGCSIRF
jgi:hypothetical protein